MKTKNDILEAKESELFKEFAKSHEGAYIGGAFFVYHYETGDYTAEFDVIIPKDSKAAVMSLGKNSIEVSEIPLKEIPEEITEEPRMEMGDIKEIIEAELKKRKIGVELASIMAHLRHSAEKNEWNCKCITKQMSMISISIDDATGAVKEFKQQSFFEFVEFRKGQKSYR